MGSRRARAVAVAMLVGVSAVAGLGAGPAAATTTATGGRAAPAGAYTHLGHTHSNNRVLRAGCQDYRYTYHVRPTTTQWALEVILVDPRHTELANDGYISGGDPLDGYGTWRICKPITRTGLFHMTGKLTQNDGDTVSEGYIETSSFRLCRAPKPYHAHPCRPAA